MPTNLTKEEIREEAESLVFTSVDDCKSSLECTIYPVEVLEKAIKISRKLNEVTRVIVLTSALNRLKGQAHIL